MNGVRLFVKVRHWRMNIAVQIASAIIILTVGPFRYSLNPDDGYLITIVAQVPLLSAVFVQASVTSPLHTQERKAAKSLRRLRAFNYVALTALGSAILGSAAFSLIADINSGSEAFGSFAVVRNLCALVGAGIVGTSLFGPSLGWIIPTVWAILPYVWLSQSSGQHEVLALVSQPDSSFTSLFFAASIWLAGLFLVTCSRDDVLDIPDYATRTFAKIFLLLNVQGGHRLRRRHLFK